jgi:5-methylcytosine-specific restriction endonuclease McrA
MGNEIEVNVIDLTLGSSKNVEVICERCGKIYPKRYHRHLESQKENGDFCKKCTVQITGDKLRKSYEEVSIIFKQNNCILLSPNYLNAHQKLEYICECGDISVITLDKFLAGERCRKCGIKKLSGENSWHWNPNLTEEEREFGRIIEGYTEWRNKVFERDHYTCQCCGQVRGNINAHHIDSYDWCKERRTDVDNGITLCSDCHKDFHHNYGYGKNTESQFDKWIKNKLI